MHTGGKKRKNSLGRNCNPRGIPFRTIQNGSVPGESHGEKLNRSGLKKELTLYSRGSAAKRGFITRLWENFSVAIKEGNWVVEKRGESSTSGGG